MAGGGIKVNNITLNGGADGATFIPSVDNDGYLSWSNNKGYPNPATVKVRGENGTIVVANPTESGTVDLTKLKVGDTTYNIPQGGGGSDVDVVQTTGQSTTAVMSQKAVTDELNNKVDKVTGKGLSSNDFTTAEKTKLAGIETGAEVNEIDTITAGENVTVSKSGKNVTISATGGGGSGTTVVANPTLTGNETNLTALQVGATKYGIKALKVTIW